MDRYVCCRRDAAQAGLLRPKHGASGIGGVHWLARADGLIYDSYGRRKYGDFSGDAEQKKDETCCGQMCLAWLCVHKEMGAGAARLI